MTSSQAAPKTGDEIVSQIRGLAAEGIGRMELIAEMRACGLSMVPSIKLLSDVLGISRGEAKRSVHLSSTWRDKLEQNDLIHDAALSTLVEDREQDTEHAAAGAERRRA